MTLTTVVADTTFVCLLALLYSLMEIEMEGQHGWAKNLPTTKNILGTFTLYHVYMLVFVFLLFGGWFFVRFLSGCMSAWTMVFHSIFYIILWFVIEDFLWFVYNPHFTIKRYKKQHIPWHANWVAGTTFGTVVGILGLLVLSFLEGSRHLFTGFGLAAGFVVLAILVAPLYHRFYISTHKNHMLT